MLTARALALFFCDRAAPEQKDYRTGESIYPADKAIEAFAGAWFLPKNYTCKATGVKLTSAKLIIANDPENEGKKEIYLKGKEPVIKPTATPDMIDSRVAAVPDSNMRTSDRAFQIEGNQGAKGSATASPSKSHYGAGAVGVETAIHAPDSAMRTSDRKFAIAGKGQTRDCKDQGSTSQYGAGSMAVETVADTEKNNKPSVSVQNVNMTERRNNGTADYRGANAEEGAE